MSVLRLSIDIVPWAHKVRIYIAAHVSRSRIIQKENRQKNDEKSEKKNLPESR